MNAKQERFGAESLRALFAAGDEVVVARGKGSETIPLRGADWEALTAKVLGRSGNLRAPTARVGKTFLVGWSESAWSQALG